MKNDQVEFADYLKAGFEPVLTADGSYTLRQKGLFEEMHARGGAFAESIYIYYEALKEFMKSSGFVEVEVISVGLGLGYNEVLSLVAAQTFNKKITVRSYEKSKILVDFFKKRLLLKQHYPLYWNVFKGFNVQNLDEEGIVFFSDFNEQEVEKLEVKERVILFDAYSSKTSPELWSEEFLVKLLTKCKSGSVFSTYAATGNLNRALKKCGFTNLSKKGFLNKRQSTFAVKIKFPT